MTLRKVPHLIDGAGRLSSQLAGSTWLGLGLGLGFGLGVRVRLAGSTSGSPATKSAAKGAITSSAKRLDAPAT